MPDQGEHPVNDSLLELIHAWCQRRDLVLLSAVLPAFTANNGLTDGWAAVMQGLRTIEASAQLPADESREVARILALVEKMVFRS